MNTQVNRRTFIGTAGAGVLVDRGPLGTGRAERAGPRCRDRPPQSRDRPDAVVRRQSRRRGRGCLRRGRCDVRQARKGRREDRRAKPPRIEKDFRRLLDDKSIDAVAIATPDHWHALMTVMACQAGKDVYVEKPASHNVVEGRRMVEAARKYDRVVQLGTQRRSTPHVREAIDHVRSGALGKVAMARAWSHQKRENIGHGQPGTGPAGIDYAMWQGPAPDRPFYANRLHYKWHWFWHWGTGELGNNGIHGVDVARWGLGVDAPLAVSSGGGKYVFDDDQETPDTQITTWEFPNACLVWEHRIWSNHPTEGSLFGIAFLGEKGTLIIDDKGWRVEEGDGAQGKPDANGQARHVQNFLDCVKSREKPNADIEIGHSEHPALPPGQYRLSRRQETDIRRRDAESFNYDQANALLTREYNPRFRNAIASRSETGQDNDATQSNRSAGVRAGYAGPLARPGSPPAQHRPDGRPLPTSVAWRGVLMPRRTSVRRSLTSSAGQARSG